jgi:CubicO group peptidase (beta-lactamase class C family)
MLTGIAIEKGILSGVDEKLSDFFPELVGTDKDGITVEHLLENASGIRWRQWGGGRMWWEMASSENWVEFILSQPMEATPGTLFNYSCGGFHLLSAILEQAAGESAADFGERYLFGPLGIAVVSWLTDPQGITRGGSSASMTARDAAKLGQLYLDGGNWRGTQIVPEWWVEQSTKYQFAGSPGTGEYGYAWWLRELAGYNVYYAMGYAGQYIFVVPELRLVTVITSRLQDAYVPQRIFRDYLLPAFE